MSVAKKLAKKSIDEKLLKKLVPLSALGADRLRELAEKADIEHASPGRTLFKRGDTDAKTYYLLSGELTVQLAGGQNVSIKADTPAALHPLLDTRPRPATAVVKSSATLLVIDAGLLDILVNYDQQQNYEVNEIQTQDESDWLTRFLQSLSAMNIPVKNIEHLMRRMQEQPVRAGETVIRQTDTDSQHYFVIKEGRCVVTKQAAADKTPIRIAELTPGFGFGEEALLAEQPRNASITMLTHGRLMRLAKADFAQLIAEPALHYVSYAQAQQMVQSGAVWLDIRSTARHRDLTIVGSTHIPLMALRTKVKELNTYGKYIAFCDSGNRAAAAAFLLRQMGFSAYVLSNGLHDVPVAALHGNTAAHALKPENPAPGAMLRTADTPVRDSSEQLKPRPQAADTVGDTAHRTDDLERTQAEAGQLRAQLAVARASEQDALQRQGQYDTANAGERAAAQAEQARLQQRIAALEAQCATADQALASQQEQRRLLQARVDEYNSRLTAADAARAALQKELDRLNHAQQRVMENLQHENSQLQTRVAAASAALEQMKTELEREVERKRTAEETLLGAEREMARLQAEADAAQRHAEELSRRASESESLQSTILKEVQRKIEAANLMRIEAEEQAQQLRETAELSRKRAEQEARKVAEAEAARAKAQSESERRARLTEDIRKKADEEVARLKQEADAARASADDARRKSQLAEAARRKLEQEIQAQLHAQSKAAEKTSEAPFDASGVENDLDDLEQELAQLQQKLESKKRAAVARNQHAQQAAEKHKTAESGIVQNVYDLNQKTQKLPAFKPNEASANDVGKVRKSGWISDSILWETTIGLREDSEAEKFLDNENVQRATAAAAATAKRQEPTLRAQSSGEIKAQEVKRSVFTARESAPVLQRHVDVSSRGSRHLGLIALLSVAAVAISSGAYVLLHKSGDATPETTNSVPNAMPNRGVSGEITNAPATSRSQTNEPAVGSTKSTASVPVANGAITRKEPVLPTGATDSAAVKPKADAVKPPVRKAEPTAPAVDAAPAAADPEGAEISEPAAITEEAEHDIAPVPQLEKSALPPRAIPVPLGAAPANSGTLDEPTPPPAESAPAEAAPVVPTFTDAPPVN